MSDSIRTEPTPEASSIAGANSLVTPDEANGTACAIQQTTAEERGEVPRKLGRCILRLQQYEMLTKAILIEHDQSGSIASWEARRHARSEKISRVTLGTLVKEMKNSYLSHGTQGEDDDDEADAPPDLDQIWFRFRGSMQMEAAEYERTIAAMDELVDMRNELVHHFLQRFNLWDLMRGAEAGRHLERRCELIDRHMNELTQWARHMEEARRFMASARWPATRFRSSSLRHQQPGFNRCTLPRQSQSVCMGRLDIARRRHRVHQYRDRSRGVSFALRMQDLEASSRSHRCVRNRAKGFA